jgi:uncharacterized OB-fold protein
MEKLCEYCGHLFMPRRSDSVYCCSSCRQMAYMERRLNAANTYPSIDGYSKTKQAYSGERHQKKTINKNIPTAYKTTESRFLIGIADLTNERDYISALNACLLIQQDKSSQETGIRLKCLAECLLLFSEMSMTELDDLKEVCNALTKTIQSKSYKQLPARFPYTNYILRLRNWIKRLIIDNPQSESIRFRLSIETKTELIATRFELSEFFPKTPFCDLNLSD